MVMILVNPHFQLKTSKKRHEGIAGRLPHQVPVHGRQLRRTQSRGLKKGPRSVAVSSGKNEGTWRFLGFNMIFHGIWYLVSFANMIGLFWECPWNKPTIDTKKT
jgi:hypothetical protein